MFRNRHFMFRIRTAAHAGGIRQRERALQHMVLHDLPAVSAQILQKLRRRPLPAQREPGTAHQPEAQPCKPALPRMRKRRYDEQAARCEHARSLIERLVWLRQQVEHIGSDDDSKLPSA